MRTVGAYEAKTHLSKLLREVAEGGTVTITRHGRVVAKLVPPDQKPADPAAVIAELRAFRRGVRSNGFLREMIDEGRA